MPINKKKMTALKKQYGAKKGEDVYYAMENIAKMSKGKKKKVASRPKRRKPNKKKAKKRD